MNQYGFILRIFVIKLYTYSQLELEKEMESLINIIFGTIFINVISVPILYLLIKTVNYSKSKYTESDSRKQNIWLFLKYVIYALMLLFEIFIILISQKIVLFAIFFGLLLLSYTVIGIVYGCIYLAQKYFNFD